MFTVKDHPRSRGVYLYSEHFDMMTGGSSPLARGLLFCIVAIVVSPLDHPRSRGVYSFPARRLEYTRGSSPLARGLPLPDGVPLPLIRIIPARAGFTALIP